MALYHFSSSQEVLSADTKIFQIFRSWIFADCQDDDPVECFWGPGVKSEMPLMIFEF